MSESMVIKDLSFCTEIPPGELAITHGGQTPVKSKFDGKVLSLQVKNFVINNGLSSITNCTAEFDDFNDEVIFICEAF